MTTDKLPAGVYTLPAGGFRAIACIGRGKGKRLEKRFAARDAEGRPIAMRTIVRWQESARRELRERPATTAGTFASDIETYMAARAAMPTRKTRHRHLVLWAAALGATRQRDTVTQIEVRTQIDAWLSAGVVRSTITANHLRTALSNFYTVLNGKTGYNPVRGLKKKPTKGKPRKPLTYPIFESILKHIPTTWRGRRRRRNPLILQRMIARMRVLAYVGLPHKQIKALQPSDLFVAERLVRVTGRDKGAGTDDVYMPIGARGLAALQEFFACGAAGPFRNETMRDLFLAGAARLGRHDLTPYDLRSLFAATVLRASKNRSALKDLMQHEDIETSAHYAQDEIRGELRAALAAFDADVVASGCGGSPPPVDKD